MFIRIILTHPRVTLCISMVFTSVAVVLWSAVVCFTSCLPAVHSVDQDADVSSRLAAYTSVVGLNCLVNGRRGDAPL